MNGFFFYHGESINTFFHYRDRLIHLLALKPYKKPELYARLQNGEYWERLFPYKVRYEYHFF